MWKEKIKELRELKSLQQVSSISVIPWSKCIPFQMDCTSLLEHKFSPPSGWHCCWLKIQNWIYYWNSSFIPVVSSVTFFNLFPCPPWSFLKDNLSGYWMWCLPVLQCYQELKESICLTTIQTCVWKTQELSNQIMCAIVKDIFLRHWWNLMYQLEYNISGPLGWKETDC